MTPLRILVFSCGSCPFNVDDTCTHGVSGFLIHTNRDGSHADLPDRCPLRARPVLVEVVR